MCTCALAAERAEVEGGEVHGAQWNRREAGEHDLQAITRIVRSAIIRIAFSVHRRIDFSSGPRIASRSDRCFVSTWTRKLVYPRLLPRRRRRFPSLFRSSGFFPRFRVLSLSLSLFPFFSLSVSLFVSVCFSLCVSLSSPVSQWFGIVPSISLVFVRAIQPQQRQIGLCLLALHSRSLPGKPCGSLFSSTFVFLVSPGRRRRA